MQTNFEVGDEVSFNNSYEEPVRGIVQRVCKGSQIEVLFDDRPYPVYVNKSNPDLKLVKQKENVVSNIRNVPHAEIQVKWLSDPTLVAEWSEDNENWFVTAKPDWIKYYDYRLIKKAPAVKKYSIAYLNPNNNFWTTSYSAGYVSIEDFFTQNESLRGTKAEIIQASMVKSDESVEVVFTSPAVDSE